MAVRQAVVSMVAGGTLSLPGALAGNPAVASIPPRATFAYITAAAGAPCQLDWRDLAAIGWAESGHGTHGGAIIAADGKLTKPIRSSVGADGPMQFMPDTARRYVTDADHDGAADVNDIDDAAPATAAKLCADGVTANRLDVLGAYNGGGRWRDYAESRNYVAAVDAYAASLPEWDGQLVGGGVAGRDRSLNAFANHVWDQYVVRGWLGLGSLLKFGRAWQGVDTLAFGGDSPLAVQPTDTFAGTWAGPGLQPQFQQRIDAMAAAAPGAITVFSGYRDPAHQAELWQTALAKYGNAETARQWVAPSDGTDCSSNHCKGKAADLTFADQATMDWAHENGPRYGVCFPLFDGTRGTNENWHAEPCDSTEVI